MEYKEVYEQLELLRDNIGKYHLNENGIKLTLKTLIDELPVPKEETLLTDYGEIRDAGLIEEAAWTARANIINEYRIPNGSCSDIKADLENMEVLIGDLLKQDDGQIVYEYLESQEGFYKEALIWLPF